MIVSWKEGEQVRKGRVIQVFHRTKSLQVIPLDAPSKYSIHIPFVAITEKGNRIDLDSLPPTIENVKLDTIATIEEICKDDQTTEVSKGDDNSQGAVVESNPDVGTTEQSSGSESTGSNQV